MSNLFISNSDNGGGIAFNVSKIVMELNECGVLTDALYLNNLDPKLIRKYLFEREEISIYCTGAHSLLLACFFLIFRNFLFKKTKIAQIIYHPRFIDPTISIFRHFLRKVVSLLPKENIYYYSDEAVSASRLVNISDSNVIGLASNFSNIESSNLDSLEYDRFKSNDYDLIISSVARFVDFKNGYLEGIINYAVKNPTVGLLLVGYGPNFDNLKRLASNSKNIFFLGQLTINQTKTVIESSHIYIGMGTTLVDATSCMIPTLIAIESSDKAISSGFFCSSNGMNFGEYNKNVKYKEIEYYLDEFYGKREVAIDFDICQPWVKLLESKSKMKYMSILKVISILFGIIFCQVVRLFAKRDYQ